MLYSWKGDRMHHKLSGIHLHILRSLTAACIICYMTIFNGLTSQLEYVNTGSGVTVYRCLHHTAPKYLVGCCTLTSDVANRQRLYVLSVVVSSSYHATDSAHSAVGASR